MLLGLNNQRVANYNKNLLLFHLFLLRQSTLSCLAERMGLSLVAVSRIVKDLVADGYVVLDDSNQDEQCNILAKTTDKANNLLASNAENTSNQVTLSTSNKVNPGRGRKAGLVRLNHEQTYIICIDLRPHTLHSVLSDLYGTVLQEVKVSSLRMSTKETVIEDIVAVVESYKKQDVLQNARVSLAVACHGQVDCNSGVSLLMPQASFHEPLYLKYLLEQKLNIEVLVDSDCAMRGLAQKWHLLRQEPKVQDFFVINLDYGIGSSFLINREIYRGSLFGSGQIGHTIIDPNGAKCSCGRHGCLETFATIAVITKNVKEALQAVDMCPDKLSFDDVVRLYKQGDTLVRSQVNRSARAIGLAIYNFLNVININHIYLYGKVTELGQEFLDVIRKQVLLNPFDSQQQVKGIATFIEVGTLSPSEQIAGIAYLYGERITHLLLEDE